MSSQPRTSRTSSIPIPREPNPNPASPRERNIESVISLPLSVSQSSSSNITSTRPRMSTTQSPPATRSTSGPWGIPSGRRASTGLAVGMGIPGMSPTRPTARSFTLSPAMPNRASPRSQPTFEPRVIRADISTSTGVSARSDDNPCLPSTSTSPTRTRRPSGAGPGGRTPSTSRAAPSSAPLSQPPNPGQAPFPRPAYLAHSALRHLLQTEAPPSLPQRTNGTNPSYHNNNGTVAGSTAGTSSNSSSSGELHAYLVRNRRGTVTAASGGGRGRGRDSVSPPDFQDSDEESTVSVPPSVPPSQPPQPTRVPLGRVGRTGVARGGAGGGEQAADVMKLPTRWSQEVRHPSLSVSTDGRELTFNGPSSNGDKDAAAARTDHPIPPACGIFYYEVEIVSKGQKGHISIGFAAGDVKLSRLPGWEKNSWGYHGDDGSSFAAEKNGTPYGPKFGTGDIVGCGIDFSQNRAFYTKNGAFLGNVFDKVGTTMAIYPSVGLRHSGEAVRVNFGNEMFKFDIEDHVLQARNLTWAGIMNTPLRREFITDNVAASSTGIDAGMMDIMAFGGKGPINRLVLSYLSHHGYAKTARAFQAQSEQRGGLAGDIFAPVGGRESNVTALPVPAPVSHPAPTPSEADVDMDMDLSTSPSKMLSTSLLTNTTPTTVRPASSPTFDGWGPGMHHRDIELRTRIVNSVIEGDIDTALVETARWHPKVLEREEGLMLFKLRCRKFVELILEAAELKKRVRVEDGTGAGSVGKIREDAEIGVDGMDVDEALSEDASVSTNGFGGGGSGSSAIPIKAKRKQSISHSDWTGAAAAQYESALSSAISYGQTLRSDYKTDSRPEVRAIFNKTFGVVAYEDPLEAGGEVAEVAGLDARMTLATELNQGILQSQGRPAHPALERLYRQAAACIVQLGLLGVGAAAFADMPKEFLDA